jgi:hypothetical protein
MYFMRGFLYITKNHKNKKKNYNDMLLKNVKRDPSKNKILKNIHLVILFLKVHAFCIFKKRSEKLAFLAADWTLVYSLYCIVMLSSVILFYNKGFWGGK